MANELRHADVGTALSKSEWEAVGTHILNSQAAGDVIYASSTSQLTRLGIGSANQFLAVNSGATAPEWTSSPKVNTAITPDASDGATLGTAALEWSDIYLADAAVIYFGDDDEVTLTHVHNDGLLLSSTDQLQFGDSGTYINQSTDGQLDLVADTEIQIAATTVDLNGNLDVSGTYTGGGLMTTGGNIVIPNAGNIGSVGDTNSIAISSSGVVTMDQIPVFSAGINVSGGTIAGTLATAAQGSVTSLGTLTALTVDDVAINGKVITMTGDTSDTTVITAGTNGTLSIVTTDDAAAAANIQITADGTVDIDSAGVLTLDSGAAINLEPAGGSAVLIDGTVSIDAGVVTGVTALTSVTVDATTDFTIGDTVITDGVVTDTSGLSIAAAVDLGSNTLTSTGSMQIRTIDYSDGDLSATIADGGGITFAQDVTMTADKSLNLPQGANIKFTDAITQDSIDDHDAQGIIMTFTAGMTVTPFSPVYLHTDDEVHECDADGIATMPCIGVSVNTSNVADGSSIEVMVLGLIRDESFTDFGTNGAPVYVSTSVGEMTNTAPTGEDDVVQVVGHSIGEKLLFVQPCLTTIEHEA